MAAVTADVHQPERATRLLGAAAALRLVGGVRLEARQAAAFVRAVADMRSSPGEAAFIAAWEAGRTHPDETADSELSAPYPT